MNAESFYNSLTEENKRALVHEFIAATYFIAHNTVANDLQYAIDTKAKSLSFEDLAEFIEVEELRAYIAEDEKDLRFKYEIHAKGNATN